MFGFHSAGEEIFTIIRMGVGKTYEKLRIRSSVSTQAMQYLQSAITSGSECWSIAKADARLIDAADQWCLRRILNIHWFDFARNGQIRQITQQPPLSVIVKSHHISLSLFGHVA